MKIVNYKEPMVLLSEGSNKGNQIAQSHECDCACTYTPLKKFKPTRLDTLCQPNKKNRVFPLPNGWQGVYIPDGSTSLAVLNQPAYKFWSNIQSLKITEKLGKESLLTVQLLIEAKLICSGNNKDVKKRSATNSQLSSWIHITDRCNLRCSYCYLPHVREDMSIETGQGAVEAIFRSAIAHNYQQVKLKYAGGEPFLRFPLIVELHQYAQELAQEGSMDLDGVVLSNGTILTEEIIKELKSLNLRLMISLDGVGGWHNVQRHYAGGRGSFKNVVQSIELALSHDLVPHISITVSGRNAAGLPEIVAWVLERNLPFSINFYRQNDLSVKYEDLKLEEEKIIAGMKAAFEVIEADLPEHSLLASLTDRANLAVPHERTCSVGQDYLVFNQHGQVSKCQMKMDETVADVHTSDPLTLIRDDKIGVQNNSVEEKEGCRDCQWKNWCTGGCPLETHRATGRYDVKSPNCNIYKAIFPEVLRLEGLRLLKSVGELEHAATD